MSVNVPQMGALMPVPGIRLGAAAAGIKKPGRDDIALLVLDEPTLGLDILYRKQFYTNLLNDYFDEERTILITTTMIVKTEHAHAGAEHIHRVRVLWSGLEEIDHALRQIAV